VLDALIDRRSVGSQPFFHTCAQVLSNATPYHTFLELLPGLSRDSGNHEEASPLPRDFQHHIRFADYQVSVCC
jgi:hypothetical protein